MAQKYLRDDELREMKGKRDELEISDEDKCHIGDNVEVILDELEMESYSKNLNCFRV